MQRAQGSCEQMTQLVGNGLLLNTQTPLLLASLFQVGQGALSQFRKR